MRRHSGFTLIELMIVIAIIAVIAAIAIPNLIEARKHNNEGGAIGGLRAVAISQELFRDGDLDEDQALDFGTLADLATVGLIDAAFGAGAKFGFHFIDTVEADKYTVHAVPASPATGSRNFRLQCGTSPPEDCEIRASASGFATEASALVPSSQGDPAGPVPMPANPVTCGVAPSQVVPTTPALQAAKNTEIEMFLASMAQSLAGSFGMEAGQLTQSLFANSGGATTQAVLASLDTSGDSRLEFGEFAAPIGQFSAADTISGVLGEFGGCAGACSAAGEDASSCGATCSASLGPAAGFEGALAGMVSVLPSFLDLGLACEEDPPSLALTALSPGNPAAFVVDTFGLPVQVPVLVAPLLGVLAVTLSVAGLRRARARKQPSPHS